MFEDVIYAALKRIDEQEKVRQQKQFDEIDEAIVAVDVMLEAEWLPQDILHYTPAQASDKTDAEVESEKFWEEMEKYELLPY